MPISDLLAQISGEAQSSVALSPPLRKRKAAGDLERTSDKQAKTDPPTVKSSKTAEQIVRPVTFVSEAAVSKTSVAKPASIKSNVLTSKTGSITPPLTEPTKPPKKGSYAEILARGKAAQAVLGQIGKIQHKPIEKGLTKRERQELKEREALLQRRPKKRIPSRARNNSRGGRDETGEKMGKRKFRQKNGKASSTSIEVPERKVKKAALATTGYTGTARPNTVTSTSLKSSASRLSGKDSRVASASSRRPTYDSEAEEDEEDEEDEEQGGEEDYDSDASSDMEAAVFEVDEEEERAARIARKEDEEALRQEIRHQHEKAEKRRKLVAMVKARR